MQEVIEVDPNWNYEFFQSYYIQPNRAGLYPNRTFLRPDKNDETSIFFTTNALGLKGAPVDETKKTAVFWGDSVIFGIGKSWVEGLNDYQAEYQFLNGGIESDAPTNVIHRMLMLNSQKKIKLNIFFPGWHSTAFYKVRLENNALDQPDEVENMLSAICAQKFVPGLVLCTMPTFLSADNWADDFSHLFLDHPDCDHLFTFWGTGASDPERVKFVHDFVMDRNAMLRRVASKYNIPLIDFYELLKFKTVEEGKAFFFDVCHIRKCKYPVIEQMIMHALKHIPGLMT